MENIESYKVNDSNFILYKKEGDIKNGGFSLASILKTQKGGSKQTDESIKEHSVIPSGLFYTENKKYSVNYTKNKEEEPHKEIPDELYEKLLELASVDDKEKQKGKKDKTKKSKPIKSNKKTFKNNAS
jgi:phosphoglycerol transferase MdoB-like AlkP superfamily enzyme